MNLQRIFGKPTQTASQSDQLQPDEAQRLQKAGGLLIDVREPEEWAAGHAAGARHIPLGQLSRHLASLPQDRDLLFICQSGSRSNVATQMARRAGLARARNVRGVTSAWIRAGLPTQG